MDTETGKCVLDDFGGDSWWDDIVNSILSPLKAIAEFFSNLWNSLIDFLKKCFIPSDGYWDKHISRFQDILNDKFGTDGMKNMLSSLEGAKSEKLPDVSMTFMGNTFKIIDMSYLVENMGIIHSIVYFVFGFLLIRYNLNNIYKIVRGGNLYDS